MFIVGMIYNISRSKSLPLHTGVRSLCRQFTVGAYDKASPTGSFISQVQWNIAQSLNVDWFNSISYSININKYHMYSIKQNIHKYPASNITGSLDHLKDVSLIPLQPSVASINFGSLRTWVESDQPLGGPLGKVLWSKARNQRWIHPPKQTWNLKMDPWKRRFLLETIISRFHVSFWGCKNFWEITRKEIYKTNIWKLMKHEVSRKWWKNFNKTSFSN